MPTSRSATVIEYLHEVAPWELARLESIGRLVSSWPDWGAARADPQQDSYSSWLRQTYGMFRNGIGMDGLS